jgi:hypothetical protein
VYNCLRRAGITTVGEVVDSLSRGDDELLQIRNLGAKSLEELKDRLRVMDLLPSVPSEDEAEEDAGETETEIEEQPEPEAVAEAPEQPEEEDEREVSAEEEPDAADEEAAAEDEEDAADEEADAEAAVDEGDELQLDDALAAALRKAMLRGGSDS